MKYNDKFDADQQITVEEGIAALIAEKQAGIDLETHDYGQFNEEECADLGREILLRVLAEFRPDLMQQKMYYCRKCGTTEISVECHVIQGEDGSLDLIDTCDKGHQCNKCGSDEIAYGYPDHDE